MYPEAVTAFNPMARDHPDWLLPWANTSQRTERPDWYLLNYGKPAALAFMTALISRRLAEYGVDIYRQDFNMPAWGSWQRNASGPDGPEEPDRVGLNEMKHIAGLYAFLDGLVARRPGLLIDNCAGGGRRMDLEMLKRSVTFWRSDAGTSQSMAYGINLWIPQTGGGFAVEEGWAPQTSAAATASDERIFRSGMAAYEYLLVFPVEFCANASAGGAGFFPTLVDQLARRKRLAPLFVADYYPLSFHSQTALCPGPVDPWRAWQFHADAPGGGRADRGVVQAFHSPMSTQLYPVVHTGRATLALFALRPDAVYQLRDWDRYEHAFNMSGAELMAVGVTLGNASSVLEAAFVVEYERVA